VGVVAGGFLNWLFALRSSRELRLEAGRLRRHTNMILRAMHNAGLAEISWNEHGEPEGLVIHFSGVVAARSSVSAEGTLTHLDPPQSREEGS
jgi:hypothetical protein